jgi:hypothetical protein
MGVRLLVPQHVRGPCHPPACAPQRHPYVSAGGWDRQGPCKPTTTRAPPAASSSDSEFLGVGNRRFSRNSWPPSGGQGQGGQGGQGGQPLPLFLGSCPCGHPQLNRASPSHEYTGEWGSARSQLLLSRHHNVVCFTKHCRRLGASGPLASSPSPGPLPGPRRRCLNATVRKCADAVLLGVFGSVHGCPQANCVASDLECAGVPVACRDRCLGPPASRPAGRPPSLTRRRDPHAQ